MLYSYSYNQVEVSVIAGGQELKKFAGTDGQQFLMAPGLGTYEIKLQNKSSQRKLFVISVDGRNIMDGKPASYDGGGYVLEAWQQIAIKGWRRTDQEVAAFEFVDLEASYDKQMGGTGSNVGVIGVAIFDEYVAPNLLPYWAKTKSILRSTDTITLDEWSLNSTSAANYGADLEGTLNLIGEVTTTTLSCNTGTASNSVKGLNSTTPLEAKQIGTGYGKKTEMLTTSTTFKKASATPKEIITLRYATEPMLRKWGVIRDPVIPAVNPFPEAASAVPAPPGWRG